jgi:ABC-type multidrug transport system fused ATPase/permease subunit
MGFLPHISSTPSTHMLGKGWPSAKEHPYFYIGIYAAITFSVAILNVIAAVIQYTGALKASRELFHRLLVGVVRATMRWHDVTPQGTSSFYQGLNGFLIVSIEGRILNRFSKDVETVDSSLSTTLRDVNSSLANFAASIITVV